MRSDIQFKVASEEIVDHFNFPSVGKQKSGTRKNSVKNTFDANGNIEQDQKQDIVQIDPRFCNNETKPLGCMAYFHGKCKFTHTEPKPEKCFYALKDICYDENCETSKKKFEIGKQNKINSKTIFVSRRYENESSSGNSNNLPLKKKEACRFRECNDYHCFQKKYHNSSSVAPKYCKYLDSKDGCFEVSCPFKSNVAICKNWVTCQKKCNKIHSPTRVEPTWLGSKDDRKKIVIESVKKSTTNSQNMFAGLKIEN